MGLRSNVEKPQAVRLGLREGEACRAPGALTEAPRARGTQRRDDRRNAPARENAPLERRKISAIRA